MTMQINVHNDGTNVTIDMIGRFDFNAHREFRNASEDALKGAPGGEIVVNMEKVEYLDSSALGMLLLLREKANTSNRKLSLHNCKGIVQQVLEVANFNKLFTIR